jgi:hypothetical protein
MSLCRIDYVDSAHMAACRFVCSLLRELRNSIVADGDSGLLFAKRSA